MRVALTQSEGRLVGLEALLIERGFEVVRQPLVQTKTIQEASLEWLSECPWWLFSSAAAVEAVIELGGLLQQRKIGAVGEATAATIEANGARVALRPSETGAEGLASAFIALHEAGPVGWPKGELALPTLAEALVKAGYMVKPLDVYRTEQVPWPKDIAAPEIAVLASPSAVDALPDAIAGNTYCVAIGATTAQRLQARGLPHSTALSPSVDGVLKSIEQIHRSGLGPLAASSRPSASSPR
jgi:uroporphyrinogen-III synthase